MCACAPSSRQRHRHARTLTLAPSAALPASTEVGPPEREHKTDRPRGTECCLGKRALGPTIILYTNGNFANPVRAGSYQFLVQPHLEFCHAIELNLSQRP